MNTNQQSLHRYPFKKNDPLQAWDSADELILQYMSSLDLNSKKILIINDQFGALSVGLKEFHPTTYTDSFVSSQGIQLNSHGEIHPITQLQEFRGPYDYVLIQVPKNMSFFEDILAHLTNHLATYSKIICGSMVKHLSPTSFELLNKYIGVTSTGLAQKKARLIFADFQKEKRNSPYPLRVKLDGFEKEFVNQSNLFSREKLDIGSRFFLEHIPQGPYQKILDLGCANGVIGIKAKMNNPNARIIFSDESQMAIQSAQENYARHFQDEAEFIWNNCFENQARGILDLVLCNPPFHQQTTVGDFIAWQMFQDAFHSLKVGGLMRVIGNSHLGYHVKLKKIFGNSKIIATNNKFMIIDSKKI